MKAAVILVVMLVITLSGSSEGAFCHTSAYKLPCSTVQAQKSQLWANCQAQVPGGVTPQGGFTTNGDCCTVVQQTADEAAWKAYSDCEKSAANSALYAPLKAAPCEALKKDAAC